MKGHKSSMAKDDIYLEPQCPVPAFEFDAQVARVFDDMISRSVPFYREIIHRQVQMIARYHQPGTAIYDLGCSNGNLLLQACRRMGDVDYKMVGVDNSAPMLEAFQERLATTSYGDRVTLECRDISQTPIENASVVVLNFTLQFLPKGERKALASKIHSGLNSGGALLFSEKITHSDSRLSELQQDFYYAFKRENGYSDLEISQKREALEKVLIPETMERHLDRLRQVGFQAVEVWQKWFNFAALIAIK
jgi:tRNA (cmo5U34)-methyltransferase